MEQVVLVNSLDEEIGVAEKMLAHQEGYLHRAFSVFLFNKNGDVLLQKRAVQKYHSGGLWTNACCSHPRPNENVLDAAHRRLGEELNITVPDIKHCFTFEYRAELDNELTENELDHVFVGCCEAFSEPNPEEVAELRFWSNSQLEKAVNESPEDFTFWFKTLIPRLAEIRTYLNVDGK